MTIFTIMIVIISNILLINAFMPMLTSNAFHTQSTSNTEVKNFYSNTLGSEFRGKTISIENYIDTARQGIRDGNFTVIGKQLDLIEEMISSVPNNASSTIVNSSSIL